MNRRELLKSIGKIPLLLPLLSVQDSGKSNLPDLENETMAKDLNEKEDIVQVAGIILKNGAVIWKEDVLNE